ncbi:disease resistance protein RPV1 [Trifolium repens]|nr:disease resistance protein RPV1 [Trifolium repens]
MTSSITNTFTYDVFLSFRGIDTRYTFTGYLHKDLQDKGIITFIDDNHLHKGDQITPSLLKAIQNSRIAIVVLSKNYASSSFCLQELCKIIDCVTENGVLVWPVFYDVEPSNVRKLSGSFGEAMAEHEVRYSGEIDRLEKWKKALNQVANLAGFHYKKGDGYEHEFIGKIVEQVSREIKLVTLPVVEYRVGLEPQRQNVLSLLNVECDDRVVMVGIHGIGGIGKTTLGLEVYNLIVHQFEGSCFLENVRENSEKHGLMYLQKIILSEIVGEKEIELTSVKQGISVIQQRLRQKKVLLLLDDVDEEKQLNAIAGRHDWFGLSSRVIITTRDKGLLTCHGVESMYEMHGLSKKDAFELLRQKAFKTNKVCPRYADVLNRALTYASGLPLALEVIGSHLFNKTIEQCKSTLDRYERIPDKKMQTILKGH